MARLEAHLALLERWQRAINLVSTASLADPWRRHYLDSAQLARLIEKTPARIIDLGSGAGFPGLVLAILGWGEVHLVESDGRKCAFLREAARLCGAQVQIHERRIESLAIDSFDVVTARGLAPLDRLLGYAAPLLAADGTCLFLKGRNFEDELTRARNRWKMQVERFPSLADPDGALLRLKDIARVGSDS